jgi:hypothetical protein
MPRIANYRQLPLDTLGNGKFSAAQKLGKKGMHKNCAQEPKRVARCKQ